MSGCGSCSMRVGQIEMLIKSPLETLKSIQGNGQQAQDDTTIMITVLRSSTVSIETIELTREIRELLDFLDEAVRLLAKNFALTDASDGVEFLRRIRRELREEQGGQQQHLWDKDHPLVGTVVESWAVQEPTTGQAVIFYAVLVKNGRLALAMQGDLEKDVKH